MPSPQTHIESTQASRWFRRSSWRIPLLLALALVVALGLFLLVRALTGDDVQAGGPLTLTPDYHDQVTAPVVIGRPYSWGQIFLHNKGDKPVRVEAFELDQVPSGLRVLGTYAQPSPEGRAIGFYYGYKPSLGRPLVGLVIPPKDIVEVVVGLAAQGKGRMKIPGARFRYVSDGKTYEATFNQAVVVCAPKAHYEACE
jgi:hypothetical protein